MERGSDWEYKKLINELAEGMEHAKQLRAYLRSASSFDTQEFLLQRILSSFEKALLTLKWSGYAEQPQPVTPVSGTLESSITVDGSPQDGDFNRTFKDQLGNREASKKRKLLPTWTEQVRVNADNGLEGPADDGYSWRKYGQKDILGAKYPRSYYRCTYRLVQNCWATKQVQRSDDDPSVFEITYKGTHTCNQSTSTVAPPASPEKQELNHSTHQNSQPWQTNQMLLNLRANLRVNTENLDSTTCPFSFPSTFTGLSGESQNFPVAQVEDNLLGTYSPSFVSPATSESNYFSASPFQMNSYGGIHNFRNSESDLTEIFSANTSATNSPIVGLDFSIDPVDLEPNFPFNNLGFLS